MSAARAWRSSSCAREGPEADARCEAPRSAQLFLLEGSASDPMRRTPGPALRRLYFDLFPGASMGIMVSNIDPPGARTGFRHPRCFASADANCSTQLSREHTISETLLRQIELNNTAKIAGLRWQAPEAFDIISISSLASKVLCDRHNNALSPLDAAIGKFSLVVREFDHAFRPAAQGAAVDESTCCGADIQRWMIKCLVGMTTSGNLNGAMKPEFVDVLYARTEWPEGWGLYWLSQPLTTVYHSDSFAIETKVHPKRRTILLARFLIRGMHFGLCLGRPGRPEALGIFKPAALIFRGQGRERRLILKWERPVTSQAVFLDRVGTYDGSPPDWRKWERES